MKIQVISLLLVATSALAQMNSMEQAPSVPSIATIAPLDRRTLIGDEYTVTNQVDNSRGKQTFSIDHNGDSSVHKGLLYDLVDPSSSSSETESRFFRRSLLGDLFGGDRTTIENVNDNSQHRQTMNSHGNKNIRVAKTEKKYGSPKAKGFFDRRDVHMDKEEEKEQVAKRSLLGDLFGSDSTSISNVNDNSKHTQTMNSHGNKNTKITKKIHREQNTAHGGDMSPEAFFDKRSLLGDLFGGDSTSISNVNDNSKHSQTMNSHGNKNTKITKKIHREQNTAHGGDMSPEALFDKRSLLGDLLGSDSTTTATTISNENDNSLRTQTMNSQGNRYSSATHIHKEVRNQGGPVVTTTEDTIVLARRGLLFGGKSTSISNVNDNSRSTKTLKSHGNTEVVKSYTDYRSRGGRGGRRHGDMYRRGLLFGGDTLQVSNENYDGRENKTLNVHDNVDKTIVYQTVVGENEGEGEEDGEMLGLAKRDSISVSNVNDNSQTTKTMNSYNNVYYREKRVAKKALGRKKSGPRRMDA
ncbi:hypothetical protein BG006_003111 [Podila minutissima]|uniref:Uncharacterized protein n=1 Tax=Podila minutissima TaxID=64525 RepID=A0A9P5SQU0_9FUNG|nr:hypothetical protein BG006_003111 [Podila minutissima]